MSVYEKLGVRPIINACGTVTRLGGAPMPPEVLAAFAEAAAEWVSLEELQAAASRRIAQVTGAEAGLVTSGAAGALTLGTAAILAGHDLRRIEQLPHCDGFPSELLISRDHRSGYDHAIRAAGARLVEVGFNEIVSNAGVRRTEPWEYETAIGPLTAGIVYVAAPDSQPPLEAVAEVARKHGLPLLVDAAGELPPRENLRKLAQQADLVAFSGGKAIRGPQSTGILCGQRELISSAAIQMLDMDDHFELWTPPPDFILRDRLAGHPRHGIGRALKVSKEEIAALLAALDLFASGAYDRMLDDYRRWLQQIADRLGSSPVTVSLLDPGDGQRWPILEIQLNSGSASRAFDLCRRLREGTPPIYVGHGKLGHATLTINPICLDDTQTEQLAQRLAAEL